MSFLVQLDAFHGPLDLLLYLVRKQELELVELSLSKVAQQYLEYVEVLEQIDADAVGEFLDVASTLLEIKSRRVLPMEIEEEEIAEEPRKELVGRLLEFKRYRDAAEQLEQRGVAWSLRRTRFVDPNQRPSVDPAEQPLAGVELWDLVSAFARVMRQRLPADPEPETILYDDTPVHVHMLSVHKLLCEASGPVSFAALFPEGPVHKSTLIGVFLAILELVRHHFALATQQARFGEIMLELGAVEPPADFGEMVAA